MMAPPVAAKKTCVAEYDGAPHPSALLAGARAGGWVGRCRGGVGGLGLGHMGGKGGGGGGGGVGGGGGGGGGAWGAGGGHPLVLLAVGRLPAASISLWNSPCSLCHRSTLGRGGKDRA